MYSHGCFNIGAQASSPAFAIIFGAQASSPAVAITIGAQASSPAIQRRSFTSGITHKSHPGWHSRGYLPHFDYPRLLQSITFRLADSLPATVLDRMYIDAQFADDQSRMRQVELQLDSCFGACYLRQPTIATVVQSALLHYDEEHYKLMAWVIMPNHVHALIEVRDGHPLSDVVQSWKSYTAHSANKMLHRQGAFWAIEYFDRFIRDADHYAHTVHYIHHNPVKAGLVLRAEEWPFSSMYQPGAQASSPA